MKGFLPAFILLLILSGCNLSGEEDPSESFTIEPNEVRIVDQQANKVTFSFINTCASSCWQNIYNSVSKVANDTYRISVIAQNSSKICPAVCNRLEREIDISLSSAGTFKFHFVHRDSIYHSFSLEFPQ